MILVRDVFQLKVGKAKDAKALFKEAAMQDPRGAEEWGAWYQKFAPLIDGGHREIMTVVE